MKPKLKYSVLLILVIMVLSFSYLTKNAAYKLGHSSAKAEMSVDQTRHNDPDHMDQYKSRVIEFQLVGMFYLLSSILLFVYVAILVFGAYSANKSLKSDAASGAA